MVSRHSGGNCPVSLINSLLLVARHGERRRTLVQTQRGTRRSSQLGSTFLTGVDRRVHAPLGTVMKFSDLLATARGRARHGRFVDVVRAGGRLLLRLMDSVLSLSGVRTGALRFGCRGISLGRLTGSIRGAMQNELRANITLRFIPRMPIYCMRARRGHLSRILVGLLIGTTGFARGNRVVFKCGVHKRRLCFCMGSANVNVSLRGRGGVFRQFAGMGAFVRKAKLKLSVYGGVIAGVGKHVKMRSRKRNGKDAF